MALSTAIYTILAADSNVSGAFSTRIYPAVAPMDVDMPCIVYEIGNIASINTKDDVTVWDEADCTVMVIATKHSDCETYAGYVRTALDGYTGTVSTEKISEIIYNGQEPGYDTDEIYSSSPQGIAIFTRTLTFTIIRIA